MLYIIYHKTDYLDYIFQGIDLSKFQVKFVELNKKTNLIQRINRKVLPHWFSFFPSLFVGKKMRKELQQLTSSDVLLVFGYAYPNLIRAINFLVNSKVKKNLWFWDPKSGDPNSIKFIQQQGFRIYTFDSSHAKQLGAYSLPQFYKMTTVNCSKNNNEFLYDFYFCGFKKNREEKINKIKDFLEEQGFKAYFHVASSMSEAISYEDNLKNIQKSKCLVEIVDDNLEGLTLRTLEALKFRRKLFTTNTKIATEEFYRKNNIYIYNEDINDDLVSFLNCEYVDISKNILMKYDINSWIQNLTTETI